MWTYEHSVDAPVRPELIWDVYRDVSTWPNWNPAVERVDLDGPFATGTTGRLTPTGQSALPFRIVWAAANEGYTSETEIADTVTLRLENTLAPHADGGVRITHRATFTGPAAPYFARDFGPTITTNTPSVMAAVVEQALAANQITPRGSDVDATTS
jgi:hypothetical protein